MPDDIRRIPDPSPNELWLHVSRMHISSIPAWDIVALANAHLLAHVRGDFINGMHFHEGQDDAES